MTEISKESGIAWIGRIPVSWDIAMLKRATYVKGRIGWQGLTTDEYLDDGDFLLVTGTDFEGGSIRWDHCAYVDQERYDEDPYIQLRESDLLVTKDGTIGKIAVVRGMPKPATLNSGVFVTRPLQGSYQQEFLYWVLVSDVFPEFIRYSMVGTTINHLYQKTFERFVYALPPLPEQQHIAAYLDASCAAIDAAVAAKRGQLNTLDKLRKSTIQRAVIEGLAESPNLVETQSHVVPIIPDRWKLYRLKDIAEIRYGLGQPPEERKDGIPMIRATNVDAGRITDQDLLFVDQNDLPLNRNPYLKQDEIIVVRSGAYTGDSAIVPSKYVGAVAGYDMVVTVTRAEPKFIAYGLLCGYILEGQMLLLTLRAAQPHLNAEELGSIIFALPPSRTEQESIVKLLDTKLAEISLIETTIGRQISTLTAYRKSLIHECVTGQRRVTEADVVRANRGRQAEAMKSF